MVAIVVVGAVLKKITILGFGVWRPGLKINALKEKRKKNTVSPLLSSKEKAASIIFWRTEILNFWGNFRNRKHPKRRIFGCV
jgi:hypothetical protein